MLITYVFLIVNQMQINFLNFYIHSILTSNLHLTNKIIKKTLFLDVLHSVTNIFTGILKIVQKSPLSLYTMLRTQNIAWHKFCLLFLTLLRGGKRRKVFQIAVFPIKFATDCLKKSEKLKCSILQMVALNCLECMKLPITSLWYKS